MNKNKICFICCLIIISIFFNGCCIKHDWKDATCDLPKCCKNCSKMKGEALGHIWSEATCLRARTCKRCGKSEGVSLEHKLGKWEVTKKATLMKIGCRERKCTVCKKVINTQNITKLPKVLGNCFNFGPTEFISYANAHMNEARYIIDTKPQKVSGGYAYSFYEGKLAIGQIVFSVNRNNYVYRITTKSVDLSVSIVLATLIARVIDINLKLQEVPYKLVISKKYISNMTQISIAGKGAYNPVYIMPNTKSN